MTESFEGAEEAPGAAGGEARPPQAPTTAGGLIRAARERQGLHIAALATAIKVSPRKLDALENDRYDELPDATFVRALAQTVCKTLKLPPAPVLALLPAADASALDHVSGALNEPFRDRPGRDEHAALAAVAVRPMVWMGLAFLVAALVLFFAPASLWQRLGSGAEAPVAASAVPAASAAALPLPVMASAPLAPEAAASAPAGPVPASSAAAVQAAAPAVSVASAVAPSVASSVATGAAASGLRVPVAAPGGLPAPVAQSAQPAPTAAPVQPTVQPNLPSAGAQAAPLQLQADQATWVDVRDARGQVLVSRLVRAGETLQMAGMAPLKLTIGNAPGTRLVFRGKVVDLAPATRDSVARLELQ